MIYTRESQGNGQHKVQEEYEALAQRHGGTKNGLPQPKETNQHGNQIQKGSAWIDTRQARAIGMIIEVREVDIRLNKARKIHDNAITI